MASPTLIELATEILAGATALQSALDRQGLPQPDLAAASGRHNYHDVLFDEPVMAARAQLIDASRSLLRLALGPTEVLRNIVTTDRTGIMVLRAVYELGIADAVPLDDDISIDGLAARLEVHPTPLRRLLRFAYTLAMFREPHARPDCVAHTAVSAAIPAFAPYLWLLLGATTRVHAASFHLARALREWPRGPLALLLADDDGPDAAPRDFWTMIQEDDPDGRGMDRFSAAMEVNMRSMHGEGNAHLIRGFDWAGLAPPSPSADATAAVVVDVGGGNGHNAIAVAKAFPRLRFVVQDLPRNQAPADELIRAAGLHEDGHVRFEPHDFFAPQPATAASAPAAYLLSRVLHDWPDADCLRILAHLLPAMRDHGARLFVVDRVLPDRPGEVPRQHEAQLRALDLLMLTLYGAGCERSRSQWEQLFRDADPALKVKRLEGLPGSELSVLEVGF